MDFGWLSSLAQRLQRRTAFTLTVSEQHLYLSLGEETLSGVIKRIPVGGERLGFSWGTGSAPYTQFFALPQPTGPTLRTLSTAPPIASRASSCIQWSPFETC